MASSVELPGNYLLDRAVCLLCYGRFRTKSLPEIGRTFCVGSIQSLRPFCSNRRLASFEFPRVPRLSLGVPLLGLRQNWRSAVLHGVDPFFFQLLAQSDTCRKTTSTPRTTATSSIR